MRKTAYLYQIHQTFNMKKLLFIILPILFCACKTIKDIFKGDTERIPGSFKTYLNYMKEWAKKSIEGVSLDKNEDNYDFKEMIKEFIAFFKKS